MVHMTVKQRLEVYDANEEDKKTGRSALALPLISFLCQVKKCHGGAGRITQARAIADTSLAMSIKSGKAYPKNMSVRLGTGDEGAKEGTAGQDRDYERLVRFRDGSDCEEGSFGALEKQDCEFLNDEVGEETCNLAVPFGSGLHADELLRYQQQRQCSDKNT